MISLETFQRMMSSATFWRVGLIACAITFVLALVEGTWLTAAAMVLVALYAIVNLRRVRREQAEE